MKKSSTLFSIAFLSFYCCSVNGQIDSSLLRSAGPKDTAKKSMNMDAIYNRPFLKMGNMPMSIGGYLESNWQYVSTSGITNGNQFEFRRLSLFFATTISKHIKFMSEIEYENDPTGDADGSKGGGFEVEYAAVDIELHPLLNIRGGMILNPIGAFNENHDGPKWEFTDRPIAMTQLLPDTWSNTGFGLYGKQYRGNWMFGYEFYVTGGFNDSIIDNAQGKTYLPAAENNPSRFTSSASGTPMYSGRLSVRHDQVGELGLSFMSDVYNTWQIEGAPVDIKRSVNVFDVDYNTTIPKLHTKIVTEWVWVFVQIPQNYTPEYSSKQFGGFIDIVQPILKRRMLGWDHASLNFAVRGEYVDWNVGSFAATGTRMYNDLWSVMPAITFRPTPTTVLRLNYRHQMQRDITGNTIGATIGFTAGFSLGLSTYF